MSKHVKRMRVFAGPNGSGKSTIIDKIKQNFFTGTYINADDIERGLANAGFINLYDYGLACTEGEFNKHVEQSGLSRKAAEAGQAITLEFRENIIKATGNNRSYEAALISEFIRLKLLESGNTFSFETVMSHPSKIDQLISASKLGYRNYLYFVATESPDINVLRVANRVAKGGHPVPEDKIRERYFRSLDLLADAIPHTYRCFIFDNTGGEYRLLAEIEQASLIHIMDEDLPIWFDRYVINKLT